MINTRIVERPELTEDELNALFSSSWDNHQPRSFSAEFAHSLTYLAAYQDAKLVGFVNVAWDGGSHAFLLDPTVLPTCRRLGIGSALVQAAAQAAEAHGAEWLHVDYEPTLEPFYTSAGFRPSRAGILRLKGWSQGEATSSGTDTGIEYRGGVAAVTVPSFLDLARRVWHREFEAGRTAAAIAMAQNVGAWTEGRLIGAVRVLSDGYLFSTVPEVMVDPDYRRRGIGRELMYRALALAPGGRLFFGAQSGNEVFFERTGFVRGPIGFVGRLEDIRNAG
jgi:GNAT superfamily N-acetyltransferase